MPPGYWRRSASGGFHGPSLGVKVSRCDGAPARLMKMADVAFAAGAFVVAFRAAGFASAEASTSSAGAPTPSAAAGVVAFLAAGRAAVLRAGFGAAATTRTESRAATGLREVA